MFVLYVDFSSFRVGALIAIQPMHSNRNQGPCQGRKRQRKSMECDRDGIVMGMTDGARAQLSSDRTRPE